MTFPSPNFLVIFLKASKHFWRHFVIISRHFKMPPNLKRGVVHWDSCKINICRSRNSLTINIFYSASKQYELELIYLVSLKYHVCNWHAWTTAGTGAGPDNAAVCSSLPTLAAHRPVSSVQYSSTLVFGICNWHITLQNVCCQLPPLIYIYALFSFWIFKCNWFSLFESARFLFYQTNL